MSQALTLKGLNLASAPATLLPKGLQAMHKLRPKTHPLVSCHTTAGMKPGLKLSKA